MTFFIGFKMENKKNIFSSINLPFIVESKNTVKTTKEKKQSPFITKFIQKVPILNHHLIKQLIYTRFYT